MHPATIMHVCKSRPSLLDDPMQVLLGHRVNARPRDRHFQMMAGKKLHHKIRLIRILDELIHPDQVGMPKLHSKLGFMHECFVVFSFFCARGEQLFEREPALGALLAGLP